MDSTVTKDDWSKFSDTYKTSIISTKDCIINIKMFHLSPTVSLLGYIKCAGLTQQTVLEDVAKWQPFYIFSGLGPIVQDFWIEIGSFIS